MTDVHDGAAAAEGPPGVDPTTGDITDREAAVEAGAANEAPPELPFAAFLQTHRFGVVHEEMGRNLRELVEAVRATRKKGTLTLTFTVAPQGERQVIVTDEVKVKLPEPDRAGAF